jgi:hypothetical protein
VWLIAKKEYSVYFFSLKYQLAAGFASASSQGDGSLSWVRRAFWVAPALRLH